MAILKEPKTLIDSAYLIKGTIGNVGMPGAPIAHFSLVVNATTGTVSGMAEITQAIDRPSIEVKVTGNVRSTGYGKVTKIANLTGEYIVSVPTPAIGSYLQKFTAYMDINDEWKGTGGFTYGNQKITDVPVTSEQ
ncbi:hypothetical protein BTO06_07820 [Tenacibaculum sp. SZ-18]|uniref:DUF1842 domain-containing protein n=1 Tax=Tenacibaculum sp. SZ-18 TaxID=754423 RepID=UPI000C2CF2F7|nr:DUF1842 domain-containing protein [Tenacibaculum sp. SZ-18]AUC15049.1 hypothetical protein BTO06_07820 [Tenacibaculum sp. SZ-18]